MQMYRPGQEDFRYLFAKVDEANMIKVIPLMLYTANRNTEYHLHQIMQKAMRQKPDKWLELVKPVITSASFIKNFLTSAAHTLYQPTFGMVYSMPRIKEILGIKNDVIDLNVKSSMYGRVTDNVHKMIESNDETAIAELTYVTHDIPQETRLDILKILTPEQLNIVSTLIDPSKRAATSKLSFEICKPQDKAGYVPSKDKRKKNDEATYQLFINNGEGKMEHIHFSHKGYFVVYLLYLCDRHVRKNNVTAIDMLCRKSQEVYIKLYHLLYPQNQDAERSYMTLTSKYNVIGKKRQSKLGDCYTKIRFTIGNACDKLGESAIPHCINDADSHLYTLPETIKIHEDVLAAFNKAYG